MYASSVVSSTDSARRILPQKKMVKTIEATARAWNANAIYVEDAGAGTTYIQSRKNLAPAPIIKVKIPNTAKAFRFDGVMDMFQAGQVAFPRKAEWLPDLEREMLEFPNGNHDDQVDSISQYLKEVRQRRRRGTRKLGGSGYAQPK